MFVNPFLFELTLSRSFARKFGAGDKKDKEARKHVQFFLSDSNALQTRMLARDESVCSPDYSFLSVRGPRGLYT